MEESTSYQLLLDKSRETVRARYGALVKLDRSTMRVKITHFSGTSTQAFLNGTAAIHKIAPGFNILNVSFSANANKLTKAVYLGGLTVKAGVQELSENIIENKVIGKRIIWLAEQIGGLRYSIVHPLKIDSTVHGAMTVFSPKPFTDAQYSAYDSFIKRIEPSYEKLRRAEDLSQQIKKIERSIEDIIGSDPMLRMASHQFSQPLLYEGLRLDPGGQALSFRGVAIIVTPREYYSLVLIMSRAKSAVSSEQLAMQVWGYPQTKGNNFVDDTILGLIKKLADVGCNDMIHQVKGYGYILQKRSPI